MRELYNLNFHTMWFVENPTAPTLELRYSGSVRGRWLVCFAALRSFEESDPGQVGRGQEQVRVRVERRAQERVCTAIVCCAVRRGSC